MRRSTGSWRTPTGAACIWCELCSLCTALPACTACSWRNQHAKSRSLQTRAGLLSCRALHDESRRRFALEDELASTRLEAGRSRDLAAQITSERWGKGAAGACGAVGWLGGGHKPGEGAGSKGPSFLVTPARAGLSVSSWSVSTWTCRARRLLPLAAPWERCACGRICPPMTDALLGTRLPCDQPGLTSPAHLLWAPGSHA